MAEAYERTIAARGRRHIRALVSIEKRVTSHVLCHTAATRMLKTVRDVRRVQECFRYADASMTQLYTEVLARNVAEAVDAVPDVEAEEKPGTCEADELADELAAEML